MHPDRILIESSDSGVYNINLNIAIEDDSCCMYFRRSFSYTAQATGCLTLVVNEPSTHRVL